MHCIQCKWSRIFNQFSFSTLITSFIFFLFALGASPAMHLNISRALGGLNLRFQCGRVAGAAAMSNVLALEKTMQCNKIWYFCQLGSQITLIPIVFVLFACLQVWYVISGAWAVTVRPSSCWCGHGASWHWIEFEKNEFWFWFFFTMSSFQVGVYELEME